jgi:hypothetical protein
LNIWQEFNNYVIVLHTQLYLFTYYLPVWSFALKILQ